MAFFFLSWMCVLELIYIWIYICVCLCDICSTACLLFCASRGSWRKVKLPPLFAFTQLWVSQAQSAFLRHSYPSNFYKSDTSGALFTYYHVDYTNLIVRICCRYYLSIRILPSWSPNPHHLICQLMILSLNSEHHGITSIGEPIPLSHWGRYLTFYMQYRVLSTFMEKYPRSASSLFQVYNDIVYGKPGSFFSIPESSKNKKNNGFQAQKWTEVEVLNLKSCTRCAISGKKKDTVSIIHFFFFSTVEFVYWNMCVCVCVSSLIG